MSQKNKTIMIAEGRFYEHISDMLFEGARVVLDRAGLNYERFEVPGALEIPGVIKYGHESERFGGYLALGCVIRGETSHYDTVANESARGIMDLIMNYNIAIGNGILTCENETQAIVRADPAQKNKGAGAAEAMIRLMTIKESLI